MTARVRVRAVSGRLRFWRRAPRTSEETARAALEGAKHQTEALRRYDPHTSEGYSSPYEGGQTPGFNPGGPF